MIRLLIVHDRPGAGNGFVGRLARADGISVVGVLDFDFDFDGDVARRAAELTPDVVVVNTDYMVSQVLPVANDVTARNPRCRLLIMSDPSKPGMLPPRRRAPGISFLPKDVPVPLLVSAIRRVARGEHVVDPRLALASMRTGKEISTRELEVLGLAAEGAPIADIARRLYLSLGTVRNHISSVIMKTGARNRIDAIRIVRKDGWLR